MVVGLGIMPLFWSIVSVWIAHWTQHHLTANIPHDDSRHRELWEQVGWWALGQYAILLPLTLGGLAYILTLTDSVQRLERRGVALVWAIFIPLATVTGLAGLLWLRLSVLPI